MYNFKVGDIVKFKKPKRFRPLSYNYESDKFHKENLNKIFKIVEITDFKNLKYNIGCIVIDIDKERKFNFSPVRFIKVNKILLDNKLFEL